MTDHLTLYHDLESRGRDILFLDEKGLKQFCLEKLLPNLDSYFPGQAARGMMDDDRRAKVFLFFLYEVLVAFGLKMTDITAGSFEISPKVFWRNEGQDCYITVFPRLLSSMAGLGFIPHTIEILNIIQKEYQMHNNIANYYLRSFAEAITKVKREMMMNHCKLERDANGEKKVSWLNLNRFALEPPELAESQKVTHCEVKVEGQQTISIPLCKHGLLMARVRGTTRIGCCFEGEHSCTEPTKA